MINGVMWNILSAYPIATVSSVAFYLLLLALAIPTSRALIEPLFTHPVPPHQQYLLGFDTLRGFAAAFVALSHSWYVSYPVFASTQLRAAWIELGAKGVAIFAVLSGFLIFRSALSSLSTIQALREYAIRRFFRIYPVYFLGIVLCACTGQYIGSERSSGYGLLFADIFMLQAVNWMDFYANPPTWSLYVEVLFYALLPLTLLVLGRSRAIPVAAIVIIAMVIADLPSRVFGLWKFFLIGIIASEVAGKMPKQYALPLFVIGIAILMFDFGGADNDWATRLGIGARHPDGATIGLGLACGLIVMSLPSLPRIGAVLNILPLRLLGIISYSVYLIQFFYFAASFPELSPFYRIGMPLYEHFKTIAPMASWYMPFVFFPGVFFWGCISFLLVERPGMRLGKWLIDRGRALPEGLRAPAE
jgi:peptidoglycan/LPS O-acetylase OafA/YrhL